MRWKITEKTNLSGAKEIVNEAVTARQELRNLKLYAQADDIRHQLNDVGVNLKDTPAGTEWMVECAR